MIFSYGELALINKGSFKIVKVGIKFDSRVTNKTRNESKISYYIEGYELRNWCYQEELRRINIFHKLLFFIFKKNK